MAITTNMGHVSRALDFFNHPDIFFGISRTAPWADELTPPAPDPATLSLDGAIGFKAIENKYLVVPDPTNGTITYRDSKWSIIDPATAIANNCRWVYIEAWLRYDELPIVQYRQVGVVTRLTRANGVAANKMALLPSEVSNQGMVEILDNRKAVYRQIDQKELLSLVIEF